MEPRVRRVARRLAGHLPARRATNASAAADPRNEQASRVNRWISGTTSSSSPALPGPSTLARRSVLSVSAINRLEVGGGDHVGQRRLERRVEQRRQRARGRRDGDEQHDGPEAEQVADRYDGDDWLH